ncbi:hypothetical protein O181_060515 [Austropuccinia psidii MF-1]|uniref:Uncharacterized protein n=1 Tax=Austropuccinia psidii MF-1 TaxID=1389203 RepID=A0A9Q3EDG9_9BASI|nr:hypothetical protein [Austropuccinia psidii MF-1]
MRMAQSTCRDGHPSFQKAWAPQVGDYCDNCRVRVLLFEQIGSTPCEGYFKCNNCKETKTCNKSMPKFSWRCINCNNNGLADTETCLHQSKCADCIMEELRQQKPAQLSRSSSTSFRALFTRTNSRRK